MEPLTTLPDLAVHIGRIHEQSQRTAVQQVNTWLSVRNWLIGFYIAEYEQHGADRAVYGERLMVELAKRLPESAGFSTRNLYNFLAFYRIYPQIFATVSQKLNEAGWHESKLLTDNAAGILQTVSAKSTDTPGLDSDLLLSRLTFSHFIELLKAETPLKRAFYEVQTVSNNWSVRELKRAVETSLFERTGLARDKATVLARPAVRSAEGRGQSAGVRGRLAEGRGRSVRVRGRLAKPGVRSAKPAVRPGRVRGRSAEVRVGSAKVRVHPAKFYTFGWRGVGTGCAATVVSGCRANRRTQGSLRFAPGNPGLNYGTPLGFFGRGLGRLALLTGAGLETC